MDVPPTPDRPLDSAPTLFPSDGEGHQKRGDHRNDRSTAQRSQPNRLKCNHHVKTTVQFIPHTIPFKSPKQPTANLPLPTKSPRRFYRTDCRLGDPGNPITAFASTSRAPVPIKRLDLRQVSASASFEQFQNAGCWQTTIFPKARYDICV